MKEKYNIYGKPKFSIFAVSQFDDTFTDLPVERDQDDTSKTGPTKTNFAIFYKSTFGRHFQPLPVFYSAHVNKQNELTLR